MIATLDAKKRHVKGKNEMHRLRRQGLVPAVVYGGSADGARAESVPLAVDPRAVLRILHSESGVNTLITLRVEGEGATPVLIKEFQLDPVTHRLLHVDFYRVRMDRAVKVTVPLVVKGEARGVRQQGGLLDFVHRELEIEALPGEIPDQIEIDVSELLVGQGIRVRDLVRDARWTPLSDPDTLLVHVVAPKAAEVAEAAPEAAAAAPAEPEVIKKGKAEKIGEEAESE